MRVLVTGGCGFIGSHLAERLVAEGHDVAILDNFFTGKRENAPAGAVIVEGDVSDPKMVHEIAGNAEVIFHLAAVASVQVCEQQPEMAFSTNVVGTAHLFQAVLARKIPIIYASSAAVYGDNPDLPLSEHSEIGPLGNYGFHKRDDERIAAASWAEFSVPSAGLRFFNVYGRRQDPKSPYSGVISKFVANAQAGLPLTFYGDGEQTRDFIHVSDVVELMIRAWYHALPPLGGRGDGGGSAGQLSSAENLARAPSPNPSRKQEGNCGVFNGCTGRATSLKQLAAAIGEVTGKKLVTNAEPAREGDIRHSLGNPQRAKTILDFDAKTLLRDGLRDLIGDV